jgi:hypothetical protein
MGTHDDLIRRLRDLGTRPVDRVVASRHLTAITEVPARQSRLTVRLTVGAAFAAGLLLGGAGLASADVLPDPAQQAAHTALAKVGIDVPPGHQRYNDPAVCPGGPYRNHGQYVRTHKDDPDAGRSPCGKPVQSVGGKGNGRGPSDADKDYEKPNKPGKAAKDDDQDESGQPGAAGGGSNGPSPTTTTESTLNPTTTSSAPSTTTSTSTP